MNHRAVFWSVSAGAGSQALRAYCQPSAVPSLTPSLRSGSVAVATLYHAECRPIIINHHHAVFWSVSAGAGSQALRAYCQPSAVPSLPPSLRSGSVAVATLCHAECRPIIINHHQAVFWSVSAGAGSRAPSGILPALSSSLPDPLAPLGVGCCCNLVPCG